METLLTIIVCLAVIVAYVAWCRRRDGRADREHQAVMIAMSPGPRIRELTTMRPNPMRTRKLASGSQPVFPAASVGDFGHVPTDYGTYAPAEVNAEIIGRSDIDTHHHHATPCAETPAHGVSHHDTCSSVDVLYGGFDGGGHHGH